MKDSIGGQQRQKKKTAKVQEGPFNSRAQTRRSPKKKNRRKLPHEEVRRGGRGHTGKNSRGGGDMEKGKEIVLTEENQSETQGVGKRLASTKALETG